MITLAAAGALLKDHWPKVIAAILVPVLIAVVANWFAKKEREEQRQEEVLVDKGRHEVIINQQERTLDNVKKANDAERAPTPDQSRSVQSKYDRCAATPAACQ